MPALPTQDQLFPHECAAADMKFSAFNPQGLSYYCTQCGGKLHVRIAREEWPQFFEGDTLDINDRVLTRIEPHPPTA
jgi:Fe-S cluster biosynthesis and repair protein YggX